MITPALYETLDAAERKLWHSHVYEVKSGMLIMPQPSVPDALWEAAENKEMEAVIQLYGKVYHLWQVDKGHTLPLGEPQLMTSITAPGQFDFEKLVGERDERFRSDYKRKQKAREHIAEPEIHPGKTRPDTVASEADDARCGPSVEETVVGREWHCFPLTNSEN